jgi:quinoprotein glucose dehydrogenase
MSYISKKSGRQFIVIAAGGNAPLSSGTGDYVIAYALPKTRQ